MEAVNIHDAKAHLSRFVGRAAAGESFIITKAGKPLVKVVALDSPRLSKSVGSDFRPGKLLCRKTLTAW
jgi:prevent-host-death family protein